MRIKNNILLKKYSVMSKEVKAALWYTICNMLLKAIALITVPIFTRVLSETDYGIVSVYAGWRDIIIILGTLNLFYSAYNTANIKYKDQLDSFTSSMLGLIFVISSLLVGIYFIGKNFFDGMIGLSPQILLVILVELYTVPAYNFWMAKERFNFKYKHVVIVTLAVSFASPLISLLLLLFFRNNQAFYKILGTSLPAIIVGGILTIFFAAKGKCFYNKEYWGYGLKFNIPLIPHYLSGTVLNQSDRIMISKMVSEGKAGIYSVAYSASFTISILTTAINQSIIPWIYNCMRTMNYASIRKRINQILVVFAVMLLAFILVIPEVITILAPASYREAISILPVLVMSVFFQFLYGFFGTVDFYFEKSVYPMLASVIAAVINLVTNFIFIPIYGYLAAGYTTLFSYIIMAITHFVFMKIVLNSNRISEEVFDIKIITTISLTFIIIGFGESLLYNVLIVRYLIAAFIAIVLFIKKDYILSVLKRGDNYYE